MNLKLKAVLTALLLLVTLTITTGCQPEETPYQINDAENYSVSVKYDANGGLFTTNTSVIVDSYNLSEINKNGSASVDIPLIAPDNAARGDDAFSAYNNGYFLAGWYTEKTDTLDDAGNQITQYSGKWDFENDTLHLDTGKSYSASEPVITLYAAWIPLFQVELYDLDSGEYLSSITYNPINDAQIDVPAWDTQTGAIEMYDFPKRNGYTFAGAYYDAEGTQPVETVVNHPGTVDYSNGVAKDPVMKLYVDWLEGEWFHIYDVKQFQDNARVNGNYVIHADLDFQDKIWPTVLMYGNFTGSIEGNGHTFKNISFEQTNNSKVNAGLFGQLTETAKITDLTFENVTFTVKSGTRVAGTSYGLLAGSISSQATLTNLQILSSTLQIDSGCYFGTDDYTVGLLCGMGSAPVDYSQISCVAVGANPESVKITVNENQVTLEFKAA